MNLTISGKIFLHVRIMRQEGQQTQIIASSSIGLSNAELSTSSVPAGGGYSTPLQARSDRVPMCQSPPFDESDFTLEQPLLRRSLVTSSSNTTPPDAWTSFGETPPNRSASQNLSDEASQLEEDSSRGEKPKHWSSKHGFLSSLRM